MKITPEAVKAAIDDAQSRRPYVGHIRCSQATFDEIVRLWKAPELVGCPGQAPDPMAALTSIYVVIDPEVPDGELKVKA